MNFIINLPEELILEILKYVDNVYSIINYLTSSKQINTIYGKMFWINLFKVYFLDAIEYCNTHITGLYYLYYKESAYKHKMRFIHWISYINKNNLKKTSRYLEEYHGKYIGQLFEVPLLVYNKQIYNEPRIYNTIILINSNTNFPYCLNHINLIDYDENNELTVKYYKYLKL